MMRHQKLKRVSSEAEAMPTLTAEDEQALSYLRAFGKILGDYGWQTYWNAPVRYEKEGTIQLLRGSLHHEFKDQEGEDVRLGIDALTFAPDATHPDASAFPLETWRDLHPTRAFTEGDAFPTRVLRKANTYIIVYSYSEALPPKLPQQLETFITGDGRQRGEFRRELAEAHRKKKEAREALLTAEKALKKAGLYEGTPKGVYGWRMKHALQRLLRRQGFYEGDIDGVFGNRTIKAMNAFRVSAGLAEGTELDTAMAQAIVTALDNPPPAASTSDSSNE